MKTAEDLTTLKAIMAHQFFGNHLADYKAFAAISKFIRRSDVPMCDKQEAWYHMNIHGMGIDEYPTAKEVREYLATAE